NDRPRTSASTPPASLLSLLSSSPDPAPPASHTLSLHDALPIYFSTKYAAPGGQQTEPDPGRHDRLVVLGTDVLRRTVRHVFHPRSEEHTSELQSRFDLVCRLLLEKKKQSDDTRGR